MPLTQVNYRHRHHLQWCVQRVLRCDFLSISQCTHSTWGIFIACQGSWMAEHVNLSVCSLIRSVVRLRVWVWHCLWLDWVRVFAQVLWRSVDVESCVNNCHTHTHTQRYMHYLYLFRSYFVYCHLSFCAASRWLLCIRGMNEMEILNWKCLGGRFAFNNRNTTCIFAIKLGK